MKPSVVVLQQYTNLEQGVLSEDPDLLQYRTHFQYRWNQYERTLDLIKEREGSLSLFATGYKRFGLIQHPHCMIYHEWAPGADDAQMIGDFNNWNGTQMHRDQFGVWSCIIPNVNGRPAIPHLSKYKIRLKHKGGWWTDVLPAWTKFAIQKKGKLDGAFDAIHWSPPEPHQWRFQAPARPTAPCIYEAHVGMSSEKPEVATYRSFADEVLPHIVDLGYNTLQLMAIQEHPYYGSCGYHVSNLFAVSSRCGTPEDLKYLIDQTHGAGLVVILDVVHSHISTNTIDGLAGFDMGQKEDMNYFKLGDKGYHRLWDSKLLNYRNWEVLRLLLSNLKWWMEEFRFDGFRFDGVTSMLYHHHGIDHVFSGQYHQYFSTTTNVDVVVYLMLANQLIHELSHRVISIAEDVSGMPTLCRPVNKGGIGFDYRLAMGIPELWIDTMSRPNEDNWNLEQIVSSLRNHRHHEKTIAYVECHDQSMVGGKTMAFRLMGTEMWTKMSALSPLTPGIRRGMALHKLIRMITFVLGGQGWMNFMGNEFGHPDWIDFPREGNGWSHDRCRRLWSLKFTSHLRYKYLDRWDQAMMNLEKEFKFLASNQNTIVEISNPHRIVIVERNSLIFIFNFSSIMDQENVHVGVSIPGQYHLVLNSDAVEFDGRGKLESNNIEVVDSRVSQKWSSASGYQHFRSQINRPYYLNVYSPSQSCIVLTNIS
eukprot:g1276.t1